MGELLVLLLIVPLAGAVASAPGKYVRRFPLGQLCGLLSLCASLVLLVFLYPAVATGAEPLSYRLGNWPEPVGISLYLDGLGWVASLVGTMVSACALGFAVAQRKHGPEFYLFFLLLVFGMEGVILTGDLFNLFVFLEILSIASYILIAGTGQARALVASFRYLMISSLGIAFFLLGIFLFYQATGSLSLRLLVEAAGPALRPGNAAAGAATRSALALKLALVCLVVGVGVKAAFLPFHTWLASAHAAAPHAVSAVLSGVMIKVSFLVVWRLLRGFGATQLQGLLMWVGAATALFGVAAALAQTDGKKLLGYSSVSQMGYIVAAFGVGSSLALGASLYHLVSHSLFKSLLFLSLGVVIQATGERDLRRLGGQARRLPLAFLFFLVGALAIAGLPPWSGYVSKGVVTAALKAQPLAYALILLAGAGTVASFLKLSGVFLGPAPDAAAAPPAAQGPHPPAQRPHPPDRRMPPPARVARRPSPLQYVPMAILALLCLAGGLFPRRFGGPLHLFAAGSAPLADGAGLPAELGPAAPYSLAHLLELGGTLAAGALLYFFGVRSRAGGRLLGRLRGLALGLDASLALVIVGFLGLVLLSWLL
jgi:formate hydrogenlyase subunit 3/multisubunit Na+/H+ antiporter MnhD subunit